MKQRYHGQDKCVGYRLSPLSLASLLKNIPGLHSYFMQELEKYAPPLWQCFSVIQSHGNDITFFDGVPRHGNRCFECSKRPFVKKYKKSFALFREQGFTSTMDFLDGTLCHLKVIKENEKKKLELLNFSFQLTFGQINEALHKETLPPASKECATLFPDLMPEDSRLPLKKSLSTPLLRLCLPEGGIFSLIADKQESNFLLYVSGREKNIGRDP
jgi:hypothetical protein